MLELRCPACGRANAAADGAALDTVRCAECTSPLDDDRLVLYRVAGEGRGWGQQVHSDLVFRARGATLHRDMLLSEEGGPWFRAGERADLFRRRSPAPPRGGAVRRSPQARVQVPGPVATMAALCQLLGILLLILAVVGFMLSASFGAAGAGAVALLVLLLLGILQLSLAKGLRRGSAAARNIQLGLAGLAGIGYLSVLGAGAGPVFALLGGLFVAIPFLLLLSPEARVWFAERSGQDA